MRKVLILATMLAFTTTATATTIEITGLDKVHKAQNVAIDFHANYGDCTTYWNCNYTGDVVPSASIKYLSIWLNQINNQYGKETFTTDYVRGTDSTLSLKFSGYQNICRVILSDKKKVNIVINEDGSCYSN